MHIINEYITPLDVQTTLTKNQYIIPIYQRNYAWEAKEIEQLIQDIIDFASNHPDKFYYIGTLVVAQNANISAGFDTIDGQQRLTTLSILTAVINNEYSKLEWFNSLNIRFASRKKSMETLNAVYVGAFPGSNYEVNIKAAYDICKTKLEEKIKENKNLSLENFIEYFFTNVKIIRVLLPDGIDLNHYFEIMNSRGEQLEKHEVLKAKLMSYFENSEKRELYEYCFNLVWEACTNMEKYIQYGFTTDQRHLIFGKDDWNELVAESFDDVANKIQSTFEQAKVTPEYQIENALLNIDKIIDSPAIELTKKNRDDQPDRFNTVINFQNFLLHVLKIQLNKEDVALDDKRLLDIFELHVPKNAKGKEDFTKTYIFNLLKCKFLFDKYIIKREFTANTDRWALKSLKWYSSGTVKNGAKYVNTFGEEQNESFDGENRQILMLLSMFHVSIPSMSYKNWLYGSLRYVYHQTEVEPKKYILYLEHIAKSFVFDNYLASDEADYYQMININLFPVKRSLNTIVKSKLCYPDIRNNLIFNFIDYLLWLRKKDNDLKIKQYEFSFRSSIEHYYPQTPIISAIPKIDEVYLHSIGNLCLISHEKNSRLNNHTPKAKQDYYAQSDSIDSIKQYLMMKEPDWDSNKIGIHEKEIIDLLSNNMNSDFSWEISGISLARKWFKLYKSQDRVQLIRTLMCFGQVDVYFGWTSGMEKYNFYQWDKIENSDVYKGFESFVQAHQPKTLQEIIDFHIQNRPELREDSYRFAFVTRPYILKYCKEGNFGWANDGKSFKLLENSRATLYQSCDLYCFCANRYIKDKYKTNSYCASDRLKISFSENDSKLEIINLDWNAAAFLEVWNDNAGHLCYELNTRDLHGNSKIIKHLKENGWEINQSGRFYHTSKQFLLKLSDDVESNIVKTEKSIFNIIQKL